MPDLVFLSYTMQFQPQSPLTHVWSTSTLPSQFHCIALHVIAWHWHGIDMARHSLVFQEICPQPPKIRKRVCRKWRVLCSILAGTAKNGRD